MRLNKNLWPILAVGAVVMAGVFMILVRPKPAPTQVEPAVSPPPAIPRPVETAAPPTPTPTDQIPRAIVPPPEDYYRPFVPTSGLVDLIKKYQDRGYTGEARKLYDLVLFIERAMRNKEKGGTRWNSEVWMKSPEYYRNLDTLSLAEECFFGNRSTFGNEMGIYSGNPHYAYYSLKIFHNGFTELFEREDFWEGMVHAYEHLSSHITTQSDYRTIIMVTMNLGHMEALYTIEPVKEKIRGHEKELFVATYNTLLRFQEYLAERVPKGERLGFFGEPVWVAETALMLAHHINPSQFSRIEPVIAAVSFSAKEQVPMELKDYIDLVVELLSEF